MLKLTNLSNVGKHFYDKISSYFNISPKISIIVILWVCVIDAFRAFDNRLF